MITVTSVEAQNRFGELIDRSQREPVEVTRRGRTVAYVVSEHDMRELAEASRRREDAARWYAEYRKQSKATTETEVDRLMGLLLSPDELTNVSGKRRKIADLLALPDGTEIPPDLAPSRELAQAANLS